MIGIRVDVNKQIATGHIKRDITIALWLRKMGHECLFISADDNCLPYLLNYGFQSVILGSRWDAMEEELETLEKIINENCIESLLVDSYMITEKYMKRLTEITVVTYFDELGKFGYGCQQLINGVLDPPNYSQSAGRALLGANYIALRQEFSGLPPKRIRPKLEKLMITSGGADNYHFCVEFLKYIFRQPQWSELKIVVVIGEFSEDKEILQQMCEEIERVALYVNTSHMAELMQDADYIVTAGGTTLYEVCAVGLAASCYAIADNQVQEVQSFDQRKLISYAGDFRVKPQDTIRQIMLHMEQARPMEFRKQQADKVQKLVDGQGAKRIAEALIDATRLSNT